MWAALILEKKKKKSDVLKEESMKNGFRLRTLDAMWDSSLFLGPPRHGGKCRSPSNLGRGRLQPSSEGGRVIMGLGIQLLGTTGDRDQQMPSSSPVQIGTEKNWMLISAGDYHALGAEIGRVLMGVGSKLDGQVGDGTTTDRHSPVRIGSRAIGFPLQRGMDFTLALKSDGSLWAWGINSDGQLGDGTTTDRFSPVRVGTDSNWSDDGNGRLSFAGNQIGRVLVGMGIQQRWRNWEMAPSADRNSPVRIGSETNWVSDSRQGNLITRLP